MAHSPLLPSSDAMPYLKFEVTIRSTRYHFPAMKCHIDCGARYHLATGEPSGLAWNLFGNKIVDGTF
jgi:hypothetical protein